MLGTALYLFMWRGDAHRFLRRNRKALSVLPVAMFGLGPIEDTPEQFSGTREHLDKGLAKHAWLTPCAVAVFRGKVEPSELRFPDNNPAFRAWADTLPEALALKPRASVSESRRASCASGPSENASPSLGRRCGFGD